MLVHDGTVWKNHENMPNQNHRYSKHILHETIHHISPIFFNNNVMGLWRGATGGLMLPVLGIYFHGKMMNGCTEALDGLDSWA